MTTIRLSNAATPVRGRARWGHRTLRRLTRDAHALLAVGLVLTSLTIALVGDHDDVWRVVAISVEFLAAQAIAALAAPYLHPTTSQRLMINIARFVLAILYVSTVTGLLRTGDFRPAAVLYIPVVALAAAQGSRQAFIAGVAAIALYLLPVLSATSDTLAIDAQRAVALGGTALLLSIGTRQTISALTVTVGRLTTTLARDRRRSRQVEAVEGVGRLLATNGPDSAVLERIVGLLRKDLGYDFVSVYLGDETRMRLAAQGGYDTVIDVFDGTSGVIGRVMRTRGVAFVPDVTTDPDYRSASGSVRAEICAPMLVDGRLVGIVNVEGGGSGLDQSDVGTMTLVADRLASALALAAERERLAARAERFRRLTQFAAAVNGTLDPERLHQAIVEGLLDVLDADSVALTILDRATSRYVLRAVTGEDKGYVGQPVEPGEGLAGRAIRDRAMVIDDRFDPKRSPILSSAPGGPTEPMAGASAPLIRDDVVVGAVTVLRRDVDRPFAPDEVEAMPILAGLVALAITNTFLHVDVTELSVRDSLTGLFNRRHLDASISRMEASRTRRAAADREPASAILFDLDHFGAINKKHGHHAGDAILGAFADILRGRFRGSDLVARYGGEEFVAILDRATPEQAATIAEEVRLAFAETSVPGPDGSPIRATVSAGCAGMGADDERFVDILARADVGLVMAKRAGRNRVISA
jgi:diguanylate cyclase (GGDEF)-like protein